jgi:hypothetical protein
MHALGTVLSKWVQEQLHYKKGTVSALADYAEEMFVKIELEQYTDISPDLIAPSRAYLQGIGVDMDELDKSEWHGLQQSNKETIKLGKKIKELSTIHPSMGEEQVTHLLYKDFLMYEKHSPKLFAEMEEIANSMGVGVFTWFVNTWVTDQDLTPGFNYDPELNKILRKDYTSNEDFKKAQNNYIWKYIAEHPQDFKTYN